MNVLIDIFEQWSVKRFLSTTEQMLSLKNVAFESKIYLFGTFFNFCKAGRSCTLQISKGERHILDKFCYHTFGAV